MIQFIAKVDKNHLIIDGPSLLASSFFRLVLTPLLPFQEPMVRIIPACAELC
jgi:hypothetical protein